MSGPSSSPVPSIREADARRRDASLPVLPYLSPPVADPAWSFDPPCSIFTRADLVPDILELGSGQSLASMHLIRQLALAGSKSGARIYLTDLPEVIQLCERSVERVGAQDMDIRIRPLAWGNLEMGNEILSELEQDGRRLTHVLMFDLVSVTDGSLSSGPNLMSDQVYFPHLYPSLLRTLLQVTGQPARRPGIDVIPAEPEEEVEQRTEVILSCMSGKASPLDSVDSPVLLADKTRSLNFEQPFFHAFSAYFEMQQLFSRPTVSAPPPATPQDPLTQHSAQNTATKTGWLPHGLADDTIIYICKRYPETLVPDWPPPDDSEVMRGVHGRDADQRGQGWEEGLLGAIEWD